MPSVFLTLLVGPQGSFQSINYPTLKVLIGVTVKSFGGPSLSRCKRVEIGDWVLSHFVFTVLRFIFCVCVFCVCTFCVYYMLYYCNIVDLMGLKPDR